MTTGINFVDKDGAIKEKDIVNTLLRVPRQRILIAEDVISESEPPKHVMLRGKSSERVSSP